MTKFEIITIILSALAIVSSIISLIINYRISKRQNKLEEELIQKQLKLIENEEKEKSKAKIKVEKSNSKLYISNVGNASAKNITFEVNPREDKALPMIKDDIEKFPIKNLDPGDSIKLYWSIDSGTAKEFDTICKWENEDGAKGIKETFIS